MQMRQLNTPMLSDGPDAASDGADSRPSRPRRRSVDGEDKEGWLSYLKKNGPTIVSLLSVLLNVIVLSAVIPSLKSDVSYAKGQTDSLQSTVNNYVQAFATIQSQINTAQGQIAQFSASFNATLALAADADMQARVILTEIGTAQLAANNLTAAINSSLAQMLNVRSDFTQRIAPQAEHDLAAAANSSLAQMLAVRSGFVDVTVPAVVQQLQSFNATAALAQLAAVGSTHSWTPELQFGGVAVSTAPMGGYTLIGNSVCMHLELSVIAVGTATGVVAIIGLPEEIAAPNQIPLAFTSTLNIGDGASLQVYANFHTIYIDSVTASGVSTRVTNTAFSQNTNFAASGCWQQ